VLAIAIMASVESKAETGADSGNLDTGEDTGLWDGEPEDTADMDTGLEEAEIPGIPTYDLVGEGGSYSCADAAAVFLLLPWAAWRRRRLD
jgi:hypothetical protein